MNGFITRFRLQRKHWFAVVCFVFLVSSLHLSSANAGISIDWDLKFPWTAGQQWAYTGGPHPFDGSSKPPFQAVDFAPSPVYNVPETSGTCFNTYAEEGQEPTPTPTPKGIPSPTPRTAGPKPATPTPTGTVTPVTTPAFSISPTSGITPTATPKISSPTSGVTASPIATATNSAAPTILPQGGDPQTTQHVNLNVAPLRSTLPIRAPHDGVVVYSVGAPHYAVTIDYNDGTGRQILLQHVAPTGRIALGTVVKQGDSIGYPSNCGYATGVHVHMVTLLNGNPYPIDGVTISGWTIRAGVHAYEGWLVAGNSSIGIGAGVVSDNAVITPDDFQECLDRGLCVS